MPRQHDTSSGMKHPAAATGERDAMVEYAIIIISHGALAVEMKKALEHLVGPQPLVAALDIPADEPLPITRQRLRQVIDALPPMPRRQVSPATDEAMAQTAEAAARHPAQRPLIFLSDLFGGTPANLAQAQVRTRHDAALVTGANLPVLVRLVELRGMMSVRAAVEEAAAAGRRFIRTEHAPDAASGDAAAATDAIGPRARSA